MFLSILNLHIQKTQTVCWHLNEVKDVLQTPCDVFLLDFFFKLGHKTSKRDQKQHLQK